MQTGYQIFEISKDRYWIKTSTGKPLWLPLNHQNQGLSKQAVDLLLEDIIYSDSDGISDRPSNSLCYTLYGLMGESQKLQVEKASTIKRMIQWDRCYRLEPDPIWQYEQKKSIASVINFLTKNGIQWVDLILNYSKTLKEMKKNEVDEVPEDIAEIISSLYGKMSDIQQFFTLILFYFSMDVSITLPVLFVIGEIDIDQFIDGFMHFQLSHEELMDSKGMKKWKAANKQRIMNAQKFLQIIEEETK